MPRHAHDQRAAEIAASWSFALMADWCDVIRTPQRTEAIEATPGYRLAAFAARHAQCVFDTLHALQFSARESAETRQSYQQRSRDPSREVAAVVRPRPAVRVGGGAGEAPQAALQLNADPS